MSVLGVSLIVVGIAIFLTGYWFTGRSQGEEQCTPPLETANKAGGIAGIVIGLIFMIAGLVVNFSQENSEEIVQYETQE